MSNVISFSAATARLRARRARPATAAQDSAAELLVDLAKQPQTLQGLFGLIGAADFAEQPALLSRHSAR